MNEVSENIIVKEASARIKSCTVIKDSIYIPAPRAQMMAVYKTTNIQCINDPRPKAFIGIQLSAIVRQYQVFPTSRCWRVPTICDVQDAVCRCFLLDEHDPIQTDVIAELTPTCSVQW